MLFGALEAGGTKMVMAIGDENGRILEQRSIPTTTPEETMPQIIEYFKERLTEDGIKALGTTVVDVKIYTGVTGKLTVVVEQI